MSRDSSQNPPVPSNAAPRWRVVGRSPISHGYLGLEASSAILRCVVGSAQVRRVEKLPLQLATDLMHGARADDVNRRAHARPRAKMDRASGSAAAGRRPSRHQARNRRGGWVAWETALLACALRGVAQGCAVLRFVSFVLAPMRLAPGAFFQTAGSAGLVASSSRMVRLRRGPLRRPLLDERARNVRPLVVRVHCW